MQPDEIGLNVKKLMSLWVKVEEIDECLCWNMNKMVWLTVDVEGVKTQPALKVNEEDGFQGFQELWSWRRKSTFPIQYEIEWVNKNKNHLAMTCQKNGPHQQKNELRLNITLMSPGLLPHSGYLIRNGRNHRIHHPRDGTTWSWRNTIWFFFVK